MRDTGRRGSDTALPSPTIHHLQSCLGRTEVRPPLREALFVWNLMLQDSCFLPSLSSISSSGTPFVSGTMNMTHRSWRTIMKAKKPKI